MEGFNWYLHGDGETLLLVAVDGHSVQPGGYPCRVVGTFAPPERRFSPAREDAGTRASRLLTQVGIPRNLLGCTYLRTALTLLLQEPGLGRNISRSLYPRIAELHGATARGVERAIRHALSQTFDRAGSEGYRSALGRLASAVGDRPTNAEFLAQAAERLRLEEVPLAA